jgi:Na+/proline symporter
MSTVSTHLNWGSSYLVLDVYKRFIKPQSSESELILVGKICTVLLMVLAMFVALQLENAYQSFEILLKIGAGTGLLFILRWFWWRINAAAEIVAMVSSFLIACYFTFSKNPVVTDSNHQLVLGVLLTTVFWVVTALITKPTDERVLKNFISKVRPGGPGWSHIQNKMDKADFSGESWKLPYGIFCMILGVIMVYSFLFGTGHLIFKNIQFGIIYLIASLVSGFALAKFYKKILS